MNIPITASTSCKLEFDIVYSGNGGAFVSTGDDTNNYWGIGVIGSGYYGFLLQNNNTRVTTQTNSGLSRGTYHCVFEYNNGSATCKINNYTFTYTYTQPLTKLFKYSAWSNSNIENMKIKPL